MRGRWRSLLKLGRVISRQEAPDFGSHVACVRSAGESGKRPLIAFFDYPDVVEDFYPHYGLDQNTFATRWADTGSHAFLSLLQREVGDVVWYSFSLKPELSEALHEEVGCRVRMMPSSWIHRQLWKLFYLPRASWRWRGAYPFYAVVASYVSLLSPELCTDSLCECGCVRSGLAVVVRW